MAKSVEAIEVEKIIRRRLREKEFKLSRPRKSGETGADIIATRDESTCFVEVIGYQSHPPTRSREFFEVFFRIISRDRNNPDDTLEIGLPEHFKKGMRQRKRQYLVAWVKLGRAFPNLELWYVNTEQGMVEEYRWSKPCD